MLTIYFFSFLVKLSIECNNKNSKLAFFMTALGRQKYLRDILVSSKVPTQQPIHPKRELKVMSKCGKCCTACPFVKAGKKKNINK